VKIIKGKGKGRPLAPPERLTNWPEYKKKHWKRMQREKATDDPERNLIRYLNRIDKALCDLVA